ncbi:hypothetical protein PINS_up007031 [Pythium insidiosum]|nr:hypothetical protein PINS_up007031 [Pythium insidiosum]
MSSAPVSPAPTGSALGTATPVASAPVSPAPTTPPSAGAEASADAPPSGVGSISGSPLPSPRARAPAESQSAGSGRAPGSPSASSSAHVSPQSSSARVSHGSPANWRALILAPRDPAEPADSTLGPVELSTEAIRLFSRLRDLFGERNLVDRAIRTARALAWLTHAWRYLSYLSATAEATSVAALAEGKPLLDGLSLLALSRADAADRRARRYQLQLLDAEEKADDLSSRVQQLESGPAPPAQHSTPPSSSGAGSPAAARAQLDRLESEVARLRATLDAEQSRTTLSARQLDHVYRFCWQHGGGGDAQSWWQLLRACASDDSALVPDGVSFHSYRSASGSARPASSDAPSPAAWATGPYATDLLGAVTVRSAGCAGSLSGNKRAASSPGETKHGSDSDSTIEIVAPPARRQRRCSQTTNELMRDIRIQEENASHSSADETSDGESAHAPAARQSPHDQQPASKRQSSKSSTPTSSKSQSPGARRSLKVQLAREAREALDAIVSPASRKPSRARRPTSGYRDRDSFTLDVRPTPPAHQLRHPMRHELSAVELARIAAAPKRPSDQARTSTVFREVPHPQPLGSVRSQHSLFPTAAASVKQRFQVMGLPTQFVRGQSLFYPNYETSKNLTHRILERYGPDGLSRFRELYATRPWDDMWRWRVCHLYLFDPRRLSDAQVDWLKEVLVFMFENRQAIWLRGHWLVMSREWPDASMVAACGYRTELDTRMKSAFQRLKQRMPAGMTDLIWHEPAIWFPPARPCYWIVAPLDQHPLEAQLARLDEWEPARVQWAVDDVSRGRFVEALVPELVALLDRRGGKCFELPAPWNDPDYAPSGYDDPTTGTPGPNYLVPDTGDAGSPSGDDAPAPTPARSRPTPLADTSDSDAAASPSRPLSV